RQSLSHVKDRQPSLFPRRISRLDSPGNLDFWILRGHRCRRLHCIKGSQVAGEKYSVRINDVAPFMTPTAMAENFAHEWKARGFPVNRPETVAEVIATLAMDWNQRGPCYLVSLCPCLVSF